MPTDRPDTSAPRAATAPVREPTPRQIADGYVDDLIALDPVLATALGAPVGQDQWPDWSPTGLAAREALQRRVLLALDAVERAVGGREKLDDLERRCARLLRERLEAQLAVTDAGEGLRQLDTMFSPPQAVRQAFTLMPTGTEADWEVVTARVERVPQALEGYRRSLAEGRDRDLVAGPRQVEAVVAQLAGWGADGELVPRLRAAWPRAPGRPPRARRGRRRPGDPGPARVVGGRLRPRGGPPPRPGRPRSLRAVGPVLVGLRPRPRRGVRLGVVRVRATRRRVAGRGGEDPARCLAPARPWSTSTSTARRSWASRRCGPPAAPHGRDDRGPRRGALRPRPAAAAGGVDDRAAGGGGGRSLLHAPLAGLLATGPHLAADDGAGTVPDVGPGEHLVPRGRTGAPPAAGAVGLRRPPALEVPDQRRLGRAPTPKGGRSTPSGSWTSSASSPTPPRGSGTSTPSRCAPSAWSSTSACTSSCRSPPPGGPSRSIRGSGGRRTGSEFLRGQQRAARRLHRQRDRALPRLARPGHRLQARRAGVARGEGGGTAGARRARPGLRPQGVAHGGALSGLTRARRPRRRAHACCRASGPTRARRRPGPCRVGAAAVRRPRSGVPAGRRRRPGRGHRPVPQRLACRGGARPRHPVPARAGPRVRRRRRTRWASGWRSGSPAGG